MITEFEIINNNIHTGGSIYFSQVPVVGENLNHCVFKTEDIDWGSVPMSYQTYDYPGQIGNSLLSEKAEARQISIAGYIYYIPTPEEVNLYRGNLGTAANMKLSRIKSYINKTINTFDEFYIRVPDRLVVFGDSTAAFDIYCRAQSSPVYGVTEEENNNYFCKFMVTFLCLNPMFQYTKVYQFNSTADDLYAADTITWTMNNKGDVETGGMFRVTASYGSVSNPSFECTDRQGNKISMKINKTLSTGESVTIWTTDGSRSVTNNSGQNYLKYWDFESGWIHILPGTHSYNLKASSGIENARATVWFYPKIFGVEGIQ